MDRAYRKQRMHLATAGLCSNQSPLCLAPSRTTDEACCCCCGSHWGPRSVFPGPQDTCISRAHCHRPQTLGLRLSPQPCDREYITEPPCASECHPTLSSPLNPSSNPCQRPTAHTPVCVHWQPHPPNLLPGSPRTCQAPPFHPLRGPFKIPFLCSTLSKPFQKFPPFSGQE